MPSESGYKYHVNGLSTIILKGSTLPASIERDAGFCSGSSENGDDYRTELSRDSPRSSLTDASEDSVEVKFTPIIIPKNKRKSQEPSKVVCESSYPLKKRMKFEEKFRLKNEVAPEKKVNLFRPWASVSIDSNQNHEEAEEVKEVNEEQPAAMAQDVSNFSNPAKIFVRHPGVTTLHRSSSIHHHTIQQYNQEQEEPLALVAKKPSAQIVEQTNMDKSRIVSSSTSSTSISNHSTVSRRLLVQSIKSSLNSSQHQHCGTVSPPSSPIHLSSSSSSISSSSSCSTSSSSSSSSSSASFSLIQRSRSSSTSLAILPSTSTSTSTTSNDTTETTISTVPPELSSSSSLSLSSLRSSQQRNYKNMTRERRIEANARERTRVHTISAAFETLRKAIPSYSDTHKLSKLSVLRVACSYILTLGRIIGDDYSADQSAPSVAECIDEMSKIIESDGRFHNKKKDE